jgi:hypothetical protein
MDAAAQLLGENGMDAALAGKAALAGEGGGDDLDAEMRLAFRPRAGMTGVARRFIDDVEAGGRQRLGQLAPHGLRDLAHLGTPSADFAGRLSRPCHSVNPGRGTALQG